MTHHRENKFAIRQRMYRIWYILCCKIETKSKRHFPRERGALRNRESETFCFSVKTARRFSRRRCFAKVQNCYGQEFFAAVGAGTEPLRRRCAPRLTAADGRGGEAPLSPPEQGGEIPPRKRVRVDPRDEHREIIFVLGGCRRVDQADNLSV